MGPATSSEAVVLACDVGGTTVKGAAYDADLTPLAVTTRPTARGLAILDTIADIAADLTTALSAEQRRRIATLGVAIPGVVDTARGISIKAVNLDLANVPLADPLQKRLGFPVVLSHDVLAAAEAERRTSKADLTDPFVVVIGTGIAAVAYVDGHAVHGVSGQAGEFGHVVVRPGGPRCACGARGCLEAVASAGAITRAYVARTGTCVAGAREVVAALATDTAAAEVWAEATSALADGLLTVCALLAPGAIVLGGGLAEAGEVLTGPVRAQLRERARVTAVPPVLTAGLGSRAGVVGAALFAFDRLGAPVP